MSALQIVGTLLAIPVGIGSGYSMYRANFSAEATCQSLRANIVGVLDRRVDATARHMLVRRDVEAFERQCGAVDPDATAAFKELLSADKTVAPAAPVASPATASVRRIETQPQSVVRKAEPRPQLAEKQPAANVAVVESEAEPVPHDGSDAVWLAAVRRALERHQSEPARAASAAAIEPPSHAVAPRTLGELRMPAALPAPSATAPAVPLATSWTTARSPQPDADHPVPPALIPEIASLPAGADPKTAEVHSRSRLGELVAQIPLLGPALEAIDGGAH